MPSTAAPFGIRPIYHPSGLVRPDVGTIASTYGTAIYRHAPVKIVAAGGIELAAAGDRAVGVFLGVEYVDSQKKPWLSNFWPAGQVATNIRAYYTTDPAIIYEIQSSAAIALADIGSQADWGTATAGDSFTGLSQVTLNAGTLTNNGSAGLRIIGLKQDIDNAFGDTYTNVLVQFSEHQNVADIVAYGA